MITTAILKKTTMTSSFENEHDLHFQTREEKFCGRFKRQAYDKENGSKYELNHCKRWKWNRLRVKPTGWIKNKNAKKARSDNREQ